MLATKRPIVLAVDNSEAAFRAADYVVNNFTNDQLVEITHVLHHRSLTEITTPLVEELTIKEEEEQAVSFLQQHVGSRLQEAGFQYAVDILGPVHDGSGAIATAIVTFASAKEAGVIVLTKSCCKSVLSKVFTGSVVSNVVHKSFRPVLVVP